MEKTPVVIFILLLAAVVVVAAFLLLSGGIPERAAAPSPPATDGQPVRESAQPAEGTASPAPGESPAPAESREPTPEPSPDPSDEPTPLPTPEPTTEPTPEPTPALPAGRSLGSGRFTSDTGTYLNLLVEWSAAAAAEDRAEVTVTVSATHYSLFANGAYGAIHITAGGSDHVLSSPTISYDGTDFTATELASLTLSLPLDAQGTASTELSVRWDFGGSYGGTALDVIQASGTVSVG